MSVKRRFVSVILVAVMLLLAFTGCTDDTKGKVLWTPNGKDPKASPHATPTIDNIVLFGMYPQKVADTSIGDILKKNVVIDQNTGLWNEYESESCIARYDIQTGLYVYQPIKDKVVGEEQRYALCNGSYFLMQSIEWYILEENDGAYTLISASVIDGGIPFSDLYGQCSWDISTIRDWLNGTDDYNPNTGASYKLRWNFFNRAFTEEEQSKLKTVSLKAHDSKYGIDGGADTNDKVYLLSDEEFGKYFTSDSAKFSPIAYATNYAVERGVYFVDSTVPTAKPTATPEPEEGATAAITPTPTIKPKRVYQSDVETQWWLRTTGINTYIQGIDSLGLLSEGGFVVNDTTVGVRPIIVVAKGDVVNKTLATPSPAATNKP